MDYPGKIQEILRKTGIEIGDNIKVISRGGTYYGILMPHHEFSGEDILTLKLATGYNIGIKMDEKAELILVRKAKRTERSRKEMAYEQGKPTIAVLGTGGTIASYVDYRTGAVHPALNAKDLAYSVPELAELCNTRAKVLFSIFSENMKVEHWQKLAREVARQMNDEACGVIVAHGTDTMGYTASALSFMLSNFY